MGYGRWNDGYYMHDGMGWGGWVFMTVLFVLVVALLVVAVLALLRGWGQGGSRSEPQGDGRTSADRLLDERFARGEIDEEEYRRRREVLRTP